MGWVRFYRFSTTTQYVRTIHSTLMGHTIADLLKFLGLGSNLDSIGHKASRI